MKQAKITAAAVVVLAITGCAANTTSLQHAATGNAPLAVFRHGVEVESGTALVVNDGNYHMGFPPGATVRRTAAGVSVTYKGVTRSFSSTATVSTGAYHKYAKATL